MSTFRAPEPISPEHQLQHFESGSLALDLWLRERALKNDRAGYSRTFVTTPYQNGDPNDLRGAVGYYCLSAGSVSRQKIQPRDARNSPEPIPVIVLGRLAVDLKYQGIGLGASLLQDAVMRTSRVAQSIGARALLVHAISESAANFYIRFGFKPSLFDPRILYLREI